MAPRDERLANAADLLTKIAALMVDPSGLSAAGAAASGYLNLKTVLGGGARAPIAAQVAEQMRARLIDPSQGWPDEADVLFPQMLERGAPGSDTIAAVGLEADKLVDAMCKRLEAPEHLAPGMREGFSRWVTPVLRDLLDDPEFVRDLGPDIARETFTRLDRLQGMVVQFGSLALALESLSRASKDQMVVLADLFEIERPSLKSETELRDLLEKKAEEYRGFKAQIDGLDERVAAIANLKGAAQGAAERLDFDAVETLLSRVDEVETEIAAETKVTRADNALLRGRVEDAYRFLSAAADSFASVDPVEPAWQRHEYVQKLYYHGLRFGGDGLLYAIDMNEDALRSVEQSEEPDLWAGLQNNLGNALSDQGERTEGEAGADLLAQAVAAYEAALTVHTREAAPVDWARTQMNLGTALSDQGKRTAGAAGAGLLARAVAAYEAALTVRTRDAAPVQWARTQMNLGTALSDQGSRTEGAAGADLLAQAVAAYEAALTVRTREAAPVEWAMTQMNLGTALSDQGSRTEGAAGAELLAQAVTAHEAALSVYTREAAPVDWARTQESLAIAQRAWAAHERCADPCAHLRAARDHVAAALSVYDPETMSYDYGTATALRDRIAAALKARGCVAGDQGPEG